MKATLDFHALDQLFRKARTYNVFRPVAVSERLLRELYALLKHGPTGFNAQPARYLFITSPEAKARLAPALSSSNREKTLAAPVTVVVAWDQRFHEHLPRLFPAYDAKAFFDADPGQIEPAARTNATLQAAYLLIAARALGLDAGPMSGFKPALVDAEFFPDGTAHAFMVVNLGYGDPASLVERAPRLSFEEVAQIL
ncbi:putative malonic semialdehyde reductase RutE [Andreprevotia sp. IGB-42]|uniref:malonic semialdehyde reductase n=1 Tax=Andreprevotia sp. IGB-42 TaxID=2497473 RepID=UPI00135B8CCB|nr:malonic semialdehyde reductase [Andreprevotia sp. IGB-42]KAF0815170.1 putative malonic semialdehyde reductase RutE [Andreprevotia sp. IGB-42]